MFGLDQYGLVMYEAILVLSRQPILHIKWSTKLTIHWILQGMAVLLAVVGFLVIYQSKISKGKNHFETLHAKLGLVTLIATSVQAVGGLCAKYPKLIRRQLRPLTVKTLHRLAACITFNLGCISLITGLFSNWFLDQMADSHPWWKCLAALPPLMSVIVVLQVLKSVLPYFKKK
ncbi:putative transmembrane reductase CYB561D1 isoform X2 [Tachypleus tridentatus]|uniref:putative transmembrane reductase CYB561D1 isoform X2 n=1 Tax=Tachypleus tridentatus TaxID=6853 RepID=UPI003FD139B4